MGCIVVIYLYTKFVLFYLLCFATECSLYFTGYSAVYAVCKGSYLSVNTRMLSLRLCMCVCVCWCVQLINSTFVSHVRQFRVQFTPFSVAVVHIAVVLLFLVVARCCCSRCYCCCCCHSQLPMGVLFVCLLVYLTDRGEQKVKINSIKL